MLDFGLAKLTRREIEMETIDPRRIHPGPAHLTSPNATVNGTIAYMSPGAGARRRARYPIRFIFAGHRSLPDGDGKATLQARPLPLCFTPFSNWIQSRHCS